jgi:hypothetical protein
MSKIWTTIERLQQKALKNNGNLNKQLLIGSRDRNKFERWQGYLVASYNPLQRLE